MMQKTVRKIKPANDPREMPDDEFFEGAGESAAVPRPSPATTVGAVIDGWRAHGPLVHESTGITALDDATGGGPVYGTRWFFAAPPDAAKTALGVQLADTWARRGIAMGMMSADEESGDIVTRLVQRQGWTRRDCEERDADQLELMAEKLSALPIRFYGAECTIERAAADLAAFAKEIGARGSALFADSIQTITCDKAVDAGAFGKPLSNYDKVTENVRALRDVATKHHHIVLAASEMNRGAYSKKDEAENAKGMASGSGSGAIEYQARVLLSLRSVGGESDLIAVTIDKNKHGPSGKTFHLRIDRRHMTLTEADAPPELAEEGKSKAELAKQVGYAAEVATQLALTPGLTTNQLHVAMRGRLGTFAEAHVALGLHKLGTAFVKVAGERRAVLHYLAGVSVPDDVLALVAPEHRATVATARPATPNPTAPEAA